MGEFYKTSKAYKLCYASKKTSSPILKAICWDQTIEIFFFKDLFILIYVCACVYVCFYTMCVQRSAEKEAVCSQNWSQLVQASPEALGQWTLSLS